MKRRLIAALLVTAMAMTMAAGCGNSDTGDSGKDEAKTESEGTADDADEGSDADSDTGYSDLFIGTLFLDLQDRKCPKI